MLLTCNQILSVLEVVLNGIGERSLCFYYLHLVCIHLTCITILIFCACPSFAINYHLICGERVGWNYYCVPHLIWRERVRETCHFGWSLSSVPITFEESGWERPTTWFMGRAESRFKLLFCSLSCLKRAIERVLLLVSFEESEWEILTTWFVGREWVKLLFCCLSCWREWMRDTSSLKCQRGNLAYWLV